MINNKFTTTEKFIFSIVLVHILIGIYTFFYDSTFFNQYVVEDGYIENFTAVMLLLSAGFFFVAAFKNQKQLRAMMIVFGMVFLFGAGEEISWGQRIWELNTPEELKSINTQAELNFHNIKVGEVKLNKLIFSTIMYSGIFTYLLVIPLLYQFSSKVRNFKYLFIPIPRLTQGVLYLAFYLLISVIQDGKLWELQEFTFGVFLFVTLLYQQNTRFDQLVSGRLQLNQILA
ncbi:hypothetical protein V6R21_07395 [Limibacter armeniacum]|uniref:hypothetical protein n=1 Tax=Limibacter armeniacum TaxID=466084 RepID=UPI002FE68A0B